LYPSIDLENNIAPNTQLGRIIIPDKVYKNENAYNNDKYERGGEFIENLVTDNIIEFCSRWLHLADFTEFLEDMNEYYASRSFAADTTIYATHYFDGIKYVNVPIQKTDIIVPIHFEDNIKPLSFYTVRDKEITINDPRRTNSIH
jgi:hypothetical protein